MIDTKVITDILKKRGKVRGNPVAVTLFRDSIPDGYEPIQETPCAIVRYAMDDGRRVYFDRDHHDCYVGVHHAGIVPGKKEIVSGEYLSAASSFFTYEAAARLKSGTPVLPPEMARAIGACPLDALPEGVHADWIVAVSNVQNANFIGSCRLAREGVPAFCVFGTSLCGELFARPWHERNVIVTSGDVGGRMHNKIKPDQLFVIIPSVYAHYLQELYDDLKVNVNLSRTMTKPPQSPFWNKSASRGQVTSPPNQPESEKESASVPDLSMLWDDDVRELLKQVPDGIVDMVVTNAEAYAEEKGYGRVSRSSMDEQMAAMGTSIDELLNSM